MLNKYSNILSKRSQYCQAHFKPFINDGCKTLNIMIDIKDSIEMVPA